MLIPIIYCYVKTQSGVTDCFDIVTGVRQGYICHLLFSVVIVFVTKNATGEGHMVSHGVMIHDVEEI